MQAAQAVSTGTSQFAFDLFKEIGSSAPNTNIFFSPVSISLALGMAYAGSEGQTRAQMAKVLHFAGSQQAVAAGFHATMAVMGQPTSDAYQLRVANALWAQQDVQLQLQFASLMRTYCAGELRRLDFAQTEDSLATINGWVAKKTEDKITSLLHPGDIDALTRLMLTNAVYFKGDWTTPFHEKFTEPDSFTTGTGGQKQVSLMHQIGSFGYAETPDLQALELPYRGDRLAMLVLLPRTGASDRWLGFTWEKLQELRWKMTRRRVEVFLPKFKVEARLSLASTLSEMGMPDAFSPGVADFSGLTSAEAWYISAVVHHAVIDVNERGAEAAAATGAGTVLLAAFPAPPPLFRADHPFLYLIVHKPSDTTLFMGRLSEPA
jgi:serpin B